ncbi:hypothetical protein [Pseudomonas sp.]|uniref:hypothetical protein n=1 Tax=Pseudomonas sp. TaxID=306 RepID=UPI00290EB9BE|nr:hypothetical protein [Pseudomonas sp.]MDU4254917.1 hypothetical protein [Pseudomonas sp.]
MATVNPWKRFIGLLPGGHKTTAEVLDIDTAAGTSRVQLRTGAELVVAGTSVAVGSTAFLADGQVIGQAPSLPQYDIEV